MASGRYGDGLSAASVGVPSAFRLELRDERGELLDTDHSCRVAVRSRLDATAATTDATLARVGTGQFDARYTIATAGPYELNVLVQNEHIDGSPFAVP